MQYYIVSIPCSGLEALQNEFNIFLRTHRVTRTERHYNEKTNCWDFLVEYLEGPELEDPQVHRGNFTKKTDVREQLSEQLLPRFDLLKKIRKEIYQTKGLGAAYVVFNDKELKILTETQPLTAENIGTLKGVNNERLNLWGTYFTDEAVKEFQERHRSVGDKPTDAVTAVNTATGTTTTNSEGDPFSKR